jgi:hypothetical protein
VRQVKIRRRRLAGVPAGAMTSVVTRWARESGHAIVSQRVVYEKCFLDGWVVLGQAITADSLAG